MNQAAPPLLVASGLRRQYRLPHGRRLLALDDVSLELQPGETLGLVGESGCGKSTLGRCLLRLDRLDGGRIWLHGQEITALSSRALRRLRPRMQMVFQDPLAALNPRRRVGEILAEPLRIAGASGAEIAARLGRLMDLVELPAAWALRYAHEFSGGQRQRIGIARALASNPSLLVADEPVSALDVSVQAQIVNLLMDLQENLGLGMIFIAHDLSVVRQVAQRVAVMYLGSIVETGPTEAVFARPAHPYTAALLSAVPDPRPGAAATRILLSGEAPNAAALPSGCRFHPRCPQAQTLCAEAVPPLRAGATGRDFACHFPLDGGVSPMP